MTLLFLVPCCFLLDGLIKETTCNIMVDHLQSRVTPWRQYTNHVKVRGTLSKMDVFPDEAVWSFHIAVMKVIMLLIFTISDASYHN